MSSTISGNPRETTGVADLDAAERNSALARDLAESVRRENAFRASLLDQVDDAIVAVDANFRITYWNRVAERMFGLSAEEALGTDYGEAIRHAFELPERARLRRQLLEGGVLKLDLACRNRSGETLFVELSASVLRDEAGRTIGVVGIHRDVTAPRRAEEALKFSEERFRLAAQSTGDLVYEWDLQSDHVQVFTGNNIAISTDGNGRPLSGRAFLSRIHPDDRDRIQAAMRRNWEDGEPYYEEYRLLLPDGGMQYWSDSGSAIRDAAGQPQKWVGVTKDVTQARAAERANAELAAIVESAETAIITRDLDGKVLSWNAGAERIYGYSATEMIGQRLDQTVPVNRAGEIHTIKTKLQAGERVAHLETVRLTKGGSPVEVLMTVTPIRDRSGAVVGGAHVVWEISELRRLQRQLAQAQKLESVGQLAAGIAHEINTPIQYIGDNAEFLNGAFRDLSRLLAPHAEIVEALRSGPNPELADRLDRIQVEADVDYLYQEVPKAIVQLSEGVQQVARIVRAMKEFSHPGSADMVLLDINRGIESTILISKNEWKYVAEMVTDLDPELPAVPCLAGEFNQVVLNLIMNAAHAIADVMKSSGRKGEIRVSTRCNGPWAELRVADTGTGIPEAIHSKVFDPFFTTKEVGKGTGQGLSIAHAVIVKKHGGKISFETKCGSGTTFLVQLPLARTEGE